jgi:UDP-N-acetylglucosamine 2-epimerase
MAVDRVLEDVRPDVVLVQGDTTTVLMTTLAAFYRRVVVGHVEAGLRTRHRYNPFRRRSTGD